MRLIGTVTSKTNAERVSAFLMTRDISTQCDAEGEVWNVWVRDEDQVEQAKKLLHEFEQNPDAPEYQQAVEEAQRIAREKEKKIQESRSNVVQMTGERWSGPITKAAPLTVALVVISVVVSIATNFGKQRDGAAFRALALGSVSAERADELFGNGNLDSFSIPLRMASLTAGEVWRSITPIFLHFDGFHLLFNMVWLVVLGRQVESRYGGLWLAILVIMIAIPSNVIGCLVPENLDGVGIANLGAHWTILAGGMSGVVYGLFGFVWMKMIFDPKSGMYISMGNIAIILIWLVLCMAPGFFTNINNWAHGIGLVVGLVAGYFPKMLSDMGLGASSDKKSS